MSTPLARLRAQVHRAAAAPPGTYDFLPPLEATELAAFEKRQRVRLPAEHRRFLREVSAGARLTRFGPPHLLTLDAALQLLEHEGGVLAGRCPLTAADARRLIEAGRGAALHRDLKDGLLPLMEHGDGMLDLLVVTGPQRGRVWHAWEAGWTPLWRRVRGQPKQHDFVSWLSERLRTD